VETLLAESQVTPGLRAEDVDDYPLPAATIALTLFSVMKMNEHDAVSYLAG